MISSLPKHLDLDLWLGRIMLAPRPRKKCCKCKVLSADLLGVLSIDCNRRAEKRRGKPMLVVIGRGVLCCGQLVEIDGG